jgi:hypothetical protein
VTSASYDVLTGLLPFLLLSAFWLVAVRRGRGEGSPQQQLVEKLEEIRAELERLRKTVDDRERDADSFGFRS